MHLCCFDTSSLYSCRHCMKLKEKEVLFQMFKIYPEGAKSFVLLLYFLALRFRVQTPKWDCYANKNLAWCLLLRYSDGDEGLLAYCYTMIYFSILLLLTNILYYFIFKIQNKVPTCNEGRENVDSNRSRATRVRPDSSTMVYIFINV